MKVRLDKSSYLSYNEFNIIQKIFGEIKRNKKKMKNKFDKPKISWYDIKVVTS